jgi:hypothetical protein
MEVDFSIVIIFEIAEKLQRIMFLMRLNNLNIINDYKKIL